MTWQDWGQVKTGYKGGKHTGLDLHSMLAPARNGKLLHYNLLRMTLKDMVKGNLPSVKNFGQFA